MAASMLEEVFRTAGPPVLTFVKPAEFTRMFVGIRDPRKTVIVEGPSGIGKSSCLYAVLKELATKSEFLSGRNSANYDRIDALCHDNVSGTYIIDDFHRLPETLKLSFSNRIKRLADEDAEDLKFVVLGINEAGTSLLGSSPDLLHRIEVIQMRSASHDRIAHLIALGEAALNIEFTDKATIIEASMGSFNIAQLLCYHYCIQCEVTEMQSSKTTIDAPFSQINSIVQQELYRRFNQESLDFARGQSFKPNGRGPYLHVLKWVAESEVGSVNLAEELRRRREHKNSVGRIIEQGFLQDFLQSDARFSLMLHFDSGTSTLSVEDPKFLFFLRNLDWAFFARQAGYVSLEFSREYDFALSFAGADRDIAEKVHEKLEEMQISVFYDFAHQHLIVGNNVEAYLEPIYAHDASFILTLLSNHYPTRVWTAFESKLIAPRFSRSEVIPILIDGYIPSNFDVVYTTGTVTLDRSKSVDDQVENICNVLSRKINDHRSKGGG